MTVSYNTPMGRNLVAYDESGRVTGNINNAVESSGASEYLGWGSYSGADIKVVVHYPSPIAAKNEALIQRSEAEERLAVIQTGNSLFLTSGKSPMDKSYQAGINALQQTIDEIEKIDEYLKDLEELPTSKVLAELQTVSYSVFREKSPVRTLGSVYPRAYVRGPRTVGGTMVFTIFHQHVLHEVLDLNLKFYNTGTSDHDKYHYTTVLPDQIPPLDISLVFANEYGSISHMGLWGVEFVQEGTTFSIEDIFSENVVQYVARDIDPMRVIAKRETDVHGVKEEWSKTASTLMNEKLYRNNVNIRRNQFI